MRHVSNSVAVMYLGQITELAPVEELWAQPRHPYTDAAALGGPVPDPDGRPARADHLVGDVPSPIAPPSGCRFHPRCPKAAPTCVAEDPALSRGWVIAGDHLTACHFPVEDGEDISQARPSIGAEERIIETGILGGSASGLVRIRLKGVAMSLGSIGGISGKDQARSAPSRRPPAKPFPKHRPPARSKDAARGVSVSSGSSRPGIDDLPRPSSGVIVLVAIFAPVFAVLTGHGPNQQFYAPVGLTADGQPLPPSAHFLMGTDPWAGTSWSGSPTGRGSR